jgi:hypothetical protein
MPEIIKIDREQRFLEVSCSHSDEIVRLTADEYDNLCSRFGGNHGIDWYLFNRETIKTFRNNKWELMKR